MEEKSSLIKDLLKQNFKDSNTKVSKEALRAYCHFLELFVREGALRAQNQAKEDDNSKTIEFEHLEQIQLIGMSSTIELWSYALLSTLLVSVLPVLFLFFVPFLRTTGKSSNVTVSVRWLNWFLGFSAGALLGDAFLHLLSGHDHNHDHDHVEQHNHSHSHSHGMAILAGILVFFGIELFSTNSCHSHSHSHKKSDDHHEIGHQMNGFLSLLADSIHNFTDGLTLAAAWASGSTAGISTTVAIFIHEIPHELGDYAVLIRSGYSHSQVLKCQFMTAAAAFAGTLTGLILKSASNSTLFKLILPFSAGGFIYLALASIVPEILKSKTSCRKESFIQFGVFIMGILLMTILE